MKNFAWTTTLVPRKYCWNRKVSMNIWFFPLIYQIPSIIQSYWLFFIFMHLQILIHLMYFNTLHLLFFLVFRFFHLWSMGVASSWLLGLLMWLWLSWIAFCFLVWQGVQAHVVQSGNPSLLKKCWFLLAENCIWDHILGTRLLIATGLTRL